MMEIRFSEEWSSVSQIKGPEVYGQPEIDGDAATRNIHYTPLYKWANEKAKTDGKAETGFDYMTVAEMTFNKERNPPPPVTEHHVKLFVDDVCTTKPSLLSSIVRQKD